MKLFFLSSLLLVSICFARPQPRLDLIGYTESFGPRLSAQNIKSNSIKSEQLLFVGDHSRVGRPAFEYFLESIVVVYSDGTQDQFEVAKWFHTRTYQQVAIDQNKKIDSIVIRAKHDDINHSSPTHRLSIYSVFTK